jgi:sugar lactone lactonase YvrE
MKRYLHHFGVCFFIIIFLFFPQQASLNTDANLLIPKIVSLSQEKGTLLGGEKVFILGENFTPSTEVVLGDSKATKVKLVNSNKISFRVPPQESPGQRTLSVITPNGVAQSKFVITAKPLSELFLGQITTIAGGVPFLGDGLKALEASFNQPSKIALDKDGNIFIADTKNHRIRRIDSKTNIVTTVVGSGVAGFGGSGELALTTKLYFPQAVAFDKNNNLFITDLSHRVRRVDFQTKIVSVVAGDGFISTNQYKGGRFNGNNIKAIEASLNSPSDIEIDKDGNLIIVDSHNRCVRKVDFSTGIITGVAGLCRDGQNSEEQTDEDLATKLYLNPTSVTLDEDRLIVTDRERIFSVDPKSNQFFILLDYEQLPSEIWDRGGGIFLSDSVIDSEGDLIILDSFNSLLISLDKETKKVSILSNQEKLGFGGDGGLLKDAVFNEPMSITINTSGNLLIADSLNNRIREVNSKTQIVTSIIGNGNAVNLSSKEQQASFESLGSFQNLEVDPQGRLIIADTENHRVLQMDLDLGVISTIVGQGLAGFSGDNDLAKKALLNFPRDIEVDSDSNIIIADTENHRVRRVDHKTKIISTVAGNGSNTFNVYYDEDGEEYYTTDDGKLATEVGTPFPRVITVDSSNNLYVSQRLLVRKVDAESKLISTEIGCCFPTLIRVADLAVNKEGKLLALNNFFTGPKVYGLSQRYPSLFDQLISPSGMVLDDDENLFISDSAKNTILKVVPDTKEIIEIIGQSKGGFLGDGESAIDAKLQNPVSLALDKRGNLFIADGSNNAIRVVKLF